jgi:uncharacterized protein YkwD
MLRLLTIIFLFPGITVAISSQENQYQELKSLYKGAKYTECYQLAVETRNKPYGLIFEALAFYKLPNNHEIKKEKEDPFLHTLKVLKKANNSISAQNTRDKEFYTNEFREIQQTIFSKAEKQYNLGLKKRAEKYFDAMHRTFDNSDSLFVNHYAFNDDHFLKTLRSNIIKEEQNKDYYSQEIEKLIDKHYYQNEEQLRKWDNPKYRLANTAINEDYLTKEEKMIYYYLNLVRMNPELFLDTFIKPRLHVKYHGEIDVMIPVYDTLIVNNYNNTLTKNEFYNLPVHRIYMDELPGNAEDRFIEEIKMGTQNGGQRYRFNINYTGLYNYIKQNHPELLTLKNISKFETAEDGRGLIRYKLYDRKLTYYNRTYKEETNNSYYYLSLFRKLADMKPENILHPNHQLFKTAECWAIEAGKRGLKGHDRINCKKRYDAEACDYGNNNGFDVVLNLLVDKFVPSLGHRKILLGNYSELGAAIRPHDSDLDYNAVLDFNK